MTVLKLPCYNTPCFEKWTALCELYQLRRPFRSHQC